MRKPIIILLLFCSTLNAQWHYKEAVKTIALFTTSIVLDAWGDAKRESYNPNNNKMLGHTLQAMSTGLLVASPFILQVDRKNWFWYALTYGSLRVGFFDPVHNLAWGLPINFIGSTSIWDKTLKNINAPDNSMLLGRTFFITIGFLIPLKQI